MLLSYPDHRLWLPDGRHERSADWSELIAGPALMSRRRCCCSSGTPLYSCGTCGIPEKNLTVSWTNIILGNGSATLVYSATGPTWSLSCSGGPGNQLSFELVCSLNQVDFIVTYYVTGGCPTGQSQNCSTLRSNPFSLVPVSLTCGSSFNLQCSVTSISCPNLASNGYTGFGVTA